ncbi:MAG TPA: hypothetical protein VMU95_32205 [Trebonia sp.]|nr:hypothetical protein [Trebonia sp.]
MTTPVNPYAAVSISHNSSGTVQVVVDEEGYFIAFIAAFCTWQLDGRRLADLVSEPRSPPTGEDADIPEGRPPALSQNGRATQPRTRTVVGRTRHRTSHPAAAQFSRAE